MNKQVDYEEYDDWTIGSIMTYMKDNIIQIILFLSVFVIIYVVEHITQFNTMLYSSPPPTLVQNKGVKTTKNSKKVKK
jgi:hypothetical protein